jgi:hypothetical protein
MLKVELLVVKDETLEHWKLTGVEIIVDDTPEAIILSCFDPVNSTFSFTQTGNRRTNSPCSY